MRSLAFVLAVSCMAACSAQDEGVDDPTLYLTGTEEEAIQRDDGTFSCENPKKVLICHIPPGNPDNAHTICVGEPAVRAHQEHHGDPVGACGDTGGDLDAGVPAEPDAATGEPDAAPAPEPDAAPEPGPDGGVDVD